MIKDETDAGHKYAKLLKDVPIEDEDSSKEVIKIMEDEANHAIGLIKIGKIYGCGKPKLKKEDRA